MTKEELGAILSITLNVFWLGQWIDLRFFSRDRLIEQLIDKAKKDEKCFICGRPLKVISETGSQDKPE